MCELEHILVNNVKIFTINLIYFILSLLLITVKMVQIVGSYSSEIFDVLPFIQEAKSNFDRYVSDSVITSLGNCFIDYNMQDMYALMLIHRHFLMESNEVLIESFNDDISVTLPWKF